jgi:hypothetical protein
MGGGPRWTIRQIRDLERMYPRYPRYQIEQELGPHSWAAIREQAHRMGLFRASMHRDWMKIAREHRPVFNFERRN